MHESILQSMNADINKNIEIESINIFEVYAELMQIFSYLRKISLQVFICSRSFFSSLFIFGLIE